MSVLTNSRQQSILEFMYPDYKITKPIRLIELFAGIGSQAKALTNIGANFEHYRVIENDKFAVRSYNAIHGTDFKTSDIRAISGADLEIIDVDKYDYILTYSSPCTNFSTAGKMLGGDIGSGTSSSLLWEVERILKESHEQPQVLLFENVPAVKSRKFIKNFHKWQYALEKLGYKNYIKVLNAADYGIAQNRDRQLKGFLNKKNKRWAKKFKPTKIEDYPIAKTLTARRPDSCTDNYILTADNRVRRLTPLEYFRLMGFSDNDFNRCKAIQKGDAQLYKQAGNSIVVPVLEEIFKQLL